MASKYGFLDLVRTVWTTFIKESYAYQLNRKTNLLKKEIRKWKIKKEKENLLYGGGYKI